MLRSPSDNLRKNLRMASIQKRGASWVAEVCIDRKRKSKSFATKREAVSWANELEADGVRPDKTLSDLIDVYRPISERKRGYQSELSRLKHLETTNLAKLPWVKITARKLAEYRDARLEDVGQSSVRRELIILSAMFEHAVNELQWIGINPLKTVRKPSPAPPRPRGIAKEEIDAILLNLSPMAAGKQVSDMFLVSLETGMRLGELLSLRWSDVFDKYVVLRETKNGDVRNVPLSQKARDILQERRKLGGDDVFTLTTAQASKCFQRATVNGAHFHDARSEAITRLSKKLDVLQLAKMIGHRDIKSLMFYYAEKPEDIADKL